MGFLMVMGVSPDCCAGRNPKVGGSAVGSRESRNPWTQSRPAGGKDRGRNPLLQCDCARFGTHWGPASGAVACYVYGVAPQGAVITQHKTEISHIRPLDGHAEEQMSSLGEFHHEEEKETTS